MPADQQSNKLSSKIVNSSRIWLRANCDFFTEKTRFSYSTDGSAFQLIGDTSIMPYSLRTFQGVCYCLFNFNTEDREGGYADFNNFIVDEPRYRGLTQPIPYGKSITLTSIADSTILINWKGFVRPVSATDPLVKGYVPDFRILDRGNGRIALQSLSDSGFVTVKGNGLMAEVRIEKEEHGEASLFQWQDMLKGDLMLMSLATHKYLFADPQAKSLISADSPGARPDRKDGSCFTWKLSSN